MLFVVNNKNKFKMNVNVYNMNTKKNLIFTNQQYKFNPILKRNISSGTKVLTIYQQIPKV